jgi:hypothetical protein
MVISIVLLELYHALFERSCDAVNALSSALVTFYRRRGYRVLSPKVGPYLHVECVVSYDAYYRDIGRNNPRAISPRPWICNPMV